MPSVQVSGPVAIVCSGQGPAITVDLGERGELSWYQCGGLVRPSLASQTYLVVRYMSDEENIPGKENVSLVPSQHARTTTKYVWLASLGTRQYSHIWSGPQTNAHLGMLPSVSCSVEQLQTHNNISTYNTEGYYYQTTFL